MGTRPWPVRMLAFFLREESWVGPGTTHSHLILRSSPLAGRTIVPSSWNPSGAAGPNVAIEPFGGA
jgi:hypothetical protein